MWEHIDRIPAGQWFAAWDMDGKSWVTGHAHEHVIWWTKAPGRYDPAQCLILPNHEGAEQAQKEE